VDTGPILRARSCRIGSATCVFEAGKKSTPLHRRVSPESGSASSALPLLLCTPTLSPTMPLSDANSPLVAAAIAAVLVYVVLKRLTGRDSLSRPPGPKPLPIIGNLLDFPQEKSWLTYRKWHERYGDIVYVEAIGQKVVILGSASAVNDLLEQRSAIYSDRPHTTMLGL
jgi:hypothetical protein